MANLIRNGTLLSIALKSSMNPTARTRYGQTYGRR
jgi:hypothetical protein